MKMTEGIKGNKLKRAMSFIMIVMILLGSIAGSGDVVLAMTYASDEIVVEAGNIKQNGTVIFNGKTLMTRKLTDIHDGILRSLGDNTDIYEELQYGNNRYANVNSVFSKDKIEINVNEIEIANIMVAEDDIIFNASTMCSDEYTIIYSETGDINFNLGNMEFSGIIYAPNGKVKFSASDVRIQGMIIASEVDICTCLFEIDGIEEYSNIVDKLEFLSSDTILEISAGYDKKTQKYSIDITSDNRDKFDKLEVFARYGEEENFSYLCMLEEFDDIGVAEDYDIVDLVVKATTRYGESIYSNIRSFHMNGEEIEYAHLDTDEDGISDGEEYLFTKTNPYEKDTDEDGIDDYVECFYLLTNPNSKTSDGDYDEDGVSNFNELETGTNPFLKDCDMDGLLDGEDGEPLIHNKTGLTPDYDAADVIVGEYDKVINNYNEEGEIYQYIYNSMTDEIKAVCYNDQEIYYFYDMDSNVICDVRKYQNEYRVSSSKYNDNGNIVAYSNNGNVYEYIYDDYSNVISATLNNMSIVLNSEDEILYGNGDAISTKANENGYTYLINDEVVYSLSSDMEQAMETYTNIKTRMDYVYKYSEGALDYISTSTGYKVQYHNGENEYNVTYHYGDTIKNQTIYLKDTSKETSMISGDYYKNYAVGDSVIYSISKNDNEFFKIEYVFEDEQIVMVLYNEKEDIVYTYNEANQITSISKGGRERWRYEYNLIGQLTAAYDFEGKTVEKYNYDMYNNIKSVETYTYDTVIGELIRKDIYEYTSDVNSDRLTAFNGRKVSYDDIGNPLTYYDGRVFSWSGRNLDSIEMYDGFVEYAYDMSGLRVQKKTDDAITDYYYDGEDIIVEVCDEYTIWYIYDDATNVLGFTYGGEDYYYVKNASKDIVGIVDNEGRYVCGYTYDAWGKVLDIEGNVEIGEINPFRYKSYYYDVESGFYYLKTRYYDPEIRRFMSMDDVCDIAHEIVDPNLYAYCCNDPVNMYDPEGRVATEIEIFTIKEFNIQTLCLIDDIGDMWGNSVYVGVESSNSQSDFEEWWKHLNDEDIVVIIMHGMPTALTIGDNDGDLRINTPAIERLSKKDIKMLVILGCNSGHWTYRDRNVAYLFSKKITGSVLASDGTVWVGHYFKLPNDPYVLFESRGDNEYTEWTLAVSKYERDNFGWLIYDKDTAAARTTGLMTLNAEWMYRLYNQKVWIIK